MLCLICLAGWRVRMKVVGWLAIAIGLGAVLFAGGCGGGGAASGGSQPVSIFLTDSFSDDFDHVWTTVFKVEIVDDTGVVETMFDDPSGRTVDLKSLRDQAGARYLFLGKGSASSRTHRLVRVTLANSMALVPTEGVSAQAVEIGDSFPQDNLGRRVIEYPLGAPSNLGAGGQSLVIDFDLPGFAIVAGKLHPLAQDSGRVGLDDANRHESSDLQGTITAISGNAPQLSFILTRQGHTSTTVSMDASTVVYNSNGVVSPVIVNGARVEVRGAYSVTLDRFVAREIEIETTDDPPAEARGSIVVGSAQPEGSFEISVSAAHGFTPTRTQVRVIVSPSARYRSTAGLSMSKDEFFVALQSNSRVEAEGVYDSNLNTLSAFRLKLDGDITEFREAEATGKAVSINTATHGFSLFPVTEWDGFAHAGGTIAVTTNTATTYENSAGVSITRDQCFALLLFTAKTRVRGILSGGVLIADRVRLR